MINDIVKEVSEKISEEQDNWFKDVVSKYCSPDYKNKQIAGFDLVFLQNQFKLKIIRNHKKIEIEVYGEVVGYWDEDYEYEFDGTAIKLTIDKWIK